MSDDVARMLKLLEKTGYDSSPTEFEETLNRFKAHPDAVDALRKGVARRGRNEDRGSYCESASSGYSDWWKKNQMLEKLDLEDDRVFLKNADPASLRAKFPAPPENGNDVIEELREQVRELTRRVTKLESNPNRYKLGPNPSNS